ncbi:MAG: peptidyl-prolyl cis-trans isomerase [Solibacillus sp.]
MKSTRNSLHQQPPTPNDVPLLQRRLKTKPTLILFAILLVGNLFWFMLWLFSSDEAATSDEQVAAVAGEVITKQQWLTAMEDRYGKETLQSLVNEAVMEKAAKEYKITVKNAEVDLEIALLRSMSDANDTSLQTLSEAELREKVRTQLIFEHVLTKDVVIDEEASKAYYDENTSLYNLPTTYRTSIIVVDSKEAAERVKKELEGGSEFSVLAREHSLDTTSASLGGDIGFVSEADATLDKAIYKVVQSLKENETANSFVLSDGRYAIVQVADIMEGQSFSYEDVKVQIERQLALDQLPPSITPEMFWSEFDATWFYGQGK